MSAEKPDRQKVLHVHTHYATILKSSTGRFSRTSLLFSITDFEWRTWYWFTEKLKDRKANAEFNQDLFVGSDRFKDRFRDYVELGGTLLPTGTVLTPTVPRRVSDFDAARAVLISAQFLNGDILHMILHVFDLLQGGVHAGDIQNLSLDIKGENSAPREMPEPPEGGYVFSLMTERHTAKWKPFRFLATVLEDER
jgi:hypothetical protein